ncbi:LAFA_0B08152g1_1 [Lachancea sp. 'fantastica']|nr:LAFA_0B08152g1_1 [Lachancea sp. 'fantastica']
MSAVPHVVIIGGSFAGISAAEIITGSKKPVKVTIISESSHAYFSVASPRALVEPEVSKQLFHSVKDKASKINKNVSVVVGKATKVDADSNTVVVEDGTGSQQTVLYDFLILASGSRAHSPAFKLHGNYTQSRDALLDLSNKIKSAKTIAVLGGGPTAVETTGELGLSYGKDKSISIYTGASGPLANWNSKVTERASQQLKNLNVQVVNVIKASKIEENSEGKFEVQFSDGTSKTFDLAISAHGIIPNSEFLDPKMLDKRGFVETDEFLVSKAYSNILAYGDIVSNRPCTIIDIERVQASTLSATIEALVFGGSSAKKPLKNTPEMGLVPISRNGGVGVLFGWRVPSWFVRMLKSKDFMVSRGAKSFS